MQIFSGIRSVDERTIYDGAVVHYQIANIRRNVTCFVLYYLSANCMPRTRARGCPGQIAKHPPFLTRGYSQLGTLRKVDKSERFFQDSKESLP